MHKDFVRWEKPFSITSMCKDTKRKRRSTLRKVGISAEGSWGPKKDFLPQISDSIRKIPSRDEDCAKKNPGLCGQSSEAIDLSGQYEPMFSASSLQACNYNDYDSTDKVPPQPHGYTNSMLYASSGGGRSRRSTTYQQSWNEYLSAQNETESLSSSASLGLRCDEKSYHWNDRISFNEFSTYSANIKKKNLSIDDQRFDCSYDANVTEQTMNFPQAQPWDFNSMISENNEMATRSMNSNIMTNFSDMMMANSIDEPIKNTTCMTSSMHSSGARDFGYFSPSVENMNAAANNYEAFEVQQPMNFPPAMSRHPNDTVTVNTNIAMWKNDINAGNANNAIKDVDIISIARSSDAKTAMSNYATTTTDAQANLAVNGFGAGNTGNINFVTNSRDTVSAPDSQADDFLSLTEISSTSFERNFVEGQIRIAPATPAADAIAVNKYFKDDTSATATTGAAEEVDVDQMNRDLEEYLERLEHRQMRYGW